MKKNYLVLLCLLFLGNSLFAHSSLEDIKRGRATSPTCETPPDQDFGTYEDLSYGTSLTYQCVTYSGSYAQVGIGDAAQQAISGSPLFSGSAILIGNNDPGGYASFRSTSQSNFKIVSFVGEFYGHTNGYTSETYEIKGYDDGVEVVNVKNFNVTASGSYGSGNAAIHWVRENFDVDGSNSGTLNFGSGWANIDEIRFYPTDPSPYNWLYIGLDNIDFEAAEVSPGSEACMQKSTVDSIDDIAQGYGLMSQSFTACQNGKIKAIKVLSNATGSSYPVSAVQMTFRSGDVSGPIIKTVDIPTSIFTEAQNLTDYVVIDVSSENIPVVQGEQYTFGFEGDPNNRVLLYYSFTQPVNQSVYPGGQFYYNGTSHSDLDLIFEMEISPASETAIPTLTTSAARSINSTVAMSGGEVTDDGGATVTERGIVYNTFGTPTTSDTKVQIGDGTGTFSHEITDLDPETKYFVRAYAINSEGTSYGSEVNFTTLAAGTYCAPTYSSQGNSWMIQRFAVAETSYSYSLSTYSQTDNTSEIISVSPGEDYTFQITTKGWVGIGVAADFNNDGDFDDDGEILNVPVYEAASPNTYSRPITIPEGVPVGNYRLRLWTAIANSEDGVPALSPCGSYKHGTYADFTLAVTEASNNAPTASNVAFSGTLEAGKALTGSYDYADSDADTESGSTYQWYRSDDDSGSGKTAISGATAKTYILQTADGGKFISFEVTPNDGTGVGEAKESELQGPILVVTTFSGKLTTDRLFIRPDPLTREFTKQLVVSDFGPGDDDYNYFIKAITPEKTGNYSIEVTQTEEIGDTFLFLYSAFDPSSPLSGLMIANDDTDDNSSNFSKINSIDLTGGTTYIVVVTSYRAGETGNVTFEVVGSSSVMVEEVENQPVLPTVTDAQITISGATGTGGTYKIADTVTAVWNNTPSGDNNSNINSVTVDFSQFGGGSAVAATNSENTWSATYMITAGNIDAQNRNISISATNADGTTTTSDTSNSTVDNIAPIVTDANISISGATGNDGIFVSGDTVTVTWNNTAGGDNNPDSITSATMNFTNLGGSNNTTASHTGGTWTATFTITESIASVSNAKIAVTAVDNAGNSTTTAASSDVTIDTETPPVPSAPDLADTSDTGNSSTDNITTDTTPTFTGTAEANVTVTLTSSVDGTLGTTTADGSGDWSFTQSTALSANTHSITATATDIAGNTSAVSPAVSIIIDLTKPLAPTGIIVEKGNTQNDLKWDANPDSDLASYIIYGGTTSNSTKQLAVITAGTNSYTHSELTNGTSYYYRITAVDIAGNESSYSSEFNVTPKAPQIITFSTFSAKTYGDDDFDPGATSTNSSTAITYSSNDTTVATIIGGKIHIVGAGTTTIKASQEGDLSYDSALDVSQLLTISKAALEVTANADQTKVYGSEDPTFTYTATGFEAEDDESILTGALARATGEGVGTYTIEQGNLDAGANYTITYTGADFTIGTKELAVTAVADQTKVYGAEDPTFTYTAIGFEAEDDENILTGALTRVAGEGVGAYAIEQGNLDAGANYSINYTGADFTIGTKELVVTADADQTKVYGAEDPTFTFSATGFEAGDDENILTGALARVTGEGVGAYAINQGSLDAGANYSIRYSGADFSIGTKELVVTAVADQEKIYGAEDPTFTYSATGFEADDDENILTGALARVAGEGVGAYAINQGNLAAGANYSITYTGAIFTIDTKELTVTAVADQVKVYGEADPIFSVRYTGFVNGEDESVLGGSLIINREIGEDVGNYAITPSGYVSNNYMISYVEGNLEIIPAAFTGITFEDGTFTYDGNAHNISVKGMPEGASVVYANNAQTNAGNYTVTATVSQANFVDEVLTAVITIEKAAAVITSDETQTFTYDGSSKEVTASLNHEEAVLSYSPQQGAINAGTYAITVSAAETDNYMAASKEVNLVIEPAVLTGISFENNDSFTYDANPHSIFVNGLPDGASVVYNNNAQTNAGTYTVTATVSQANKHDKVFTAEMTINKAVQNIAFAALPEKDLETDTNFQLDAIASSGLPISYSYTYDSETPAAMVSPEGFVSLKHAGQITITASQAGDSDHEAAEAVTRTLTLNSSVAIMEYISINGQVYEDPVSEIYYLMECGSTENEVAVALQVNPNATVDQGSSFSIPTPTAGIYSRSVTVTSPDETSTTTYNITVEKRFDFEAIVEQKFNNVLFINNNPQTNGGYSFVSYEWFKNGSLVGTGQYYSAGNNASDLLNSNDSYSVKMTTVDGQVLQTCETSLQLKSSYKMLLTPNPVRAGEQLQLHADFPLEELKDMQISIYSLNGNLMKQLKSSQKVTPIDLPTFIQPGVYILTCKTSNSMRTLKFMVK